MTPFTALLSIMFFPAGITLILSGMLYEWADRKLVARFQNRIGPRWFQPLADTIKLLTKEEIQPHGINSLLFYGLPIVALTGALTAGKNMMERRAVMGVISTILIFFAHIF